MAPMGVAPKAEAKSKVDAAKAKEAKAAKAKKKEEEEATPKMQQPDRAKFEESLTKINEGIEKLQSKLKALSAQIGERSTGKEGFFAKKAEIRKRLDDAAALINGFQAQKDGIMTQLGSKREEGKSMRTELNKLKKDVGFTSEEQILERIQQIEYQMCTEVMPLKEEKKLLLEITELKRTRPKLAKVSNMEDSVKNFDTGAPLKEQLDTIKEQLNIHRDAKKVISEEYKALMDERTAQMGDMPELFTEREELNKQITEKIRERNEKRNEFRETEREYNAYLAEQRAARADRAREDRTKRDAEYDQQRRVRQAEKLEEQPHTNETTLIEQTIAYCQSLLPKEEVKKDDCKKEISHSNKDGEMVLLSKDSRDEEFYFAPTKKGKAAKMKKKEGGKSIKHNAETFRLFDQLKLDAPVTTDDIPALLEKLQAQADKYAAKIEEWKLNRDELKKKILAGDSIEDEKEEKKDDEDKTDES